MVMVIMKKKSIMRDPNNPCLFCNINSKDLVFDNEFVAMTHGESKIL